MEVDKDAEHTFWKYITYGSINTGGAWSTKTKTRKDVMRWELLSPRISQARLSQHLFRD